MSFASPVAWFATVAATGCQPTRRPSKTGASQRRIEQVMMDRTFAALVVVASLSLASCDQSKDRRAENVAASDGAATGGVAREEGPLKTPPMQKMAPMAVIQSQPGPDGSQVDLLKVAVTGDILTVTMRCSSDESINSELFRVANISIIDDATSQRMSVLKDNQGMPMVSDPTASGDFIGTDCAIKPGIIWAKFPAPAATSKTVSINLPDVAPFDGIPISR